MKLIWGKVWWCNCLKNCKGHIAPCLFDNFFNRPALIYKRLKDGIYAIGTVRPNQKMLKMKGDKKMSRDFQDKKISIILKT